MILKFENTSRSAHLIVFYNLENLYPAYDRLDVNSNVMPKSWSQERYLNKISKLATVISKIGAQFSNDLPSLIGVAELGSIQVLEDLIASSVLKGEAYDYIHFESPDERGSNVALIYNPKFFKLISSESYVVDLQNGFGHSPHSRNILVAHGKLEKEDIFIIVNHWPSRFGGLSQTSYRRQMLANKTLAIIENIRKKNVDAKFIVMGDFNDNPSNNSVKSLIENGGMYNPFEALQSFRRGSVFHMKKWYLFDQILVSNSFVDPLDGFRFLTADIFDADFLKQAYGRDRGTPFRTYDRLTYTGGFSDHFPVYLRLKKTK